MKILVDSKVDQDIALLDEAWSTPETFFFIPQKSGLPENWMSEAMKAIPEDLHIDHFGLLTSGSTGMPKLVIGNRQRSEALIKVLHELQESEPVKQTIIALPLIYCYAFVNQWLWSKVYRRRRIQVPGLGQPEIFQKALRNAEDAMLCMVGAQVPLLQRLFTEEVFPNIIRVHFAGGPFPQKHLANLQAIFPDAKIFNNYGCAEAMPRLTLRLAGREKPQTNIGPPLPGIEMRAGELSEITFRSIYGAVAFVDNTGFHRIGNDEYVGTGDLGRPMKDGSWEIFGRMSEVFKRYGEKISLPRILNLVTPAWTGHAANYRQSDSNEEDGYVLVLSPHPGHEDVRTILKKFRAHFARPHWPLRIESVDAIPFLKNGKIDTLTLKEMPGKTIHWDQKV